MILMKVWCNVPQGVAIEPQLIADGSGRVSIEISSRRTGA